ncbi:MAG TPA: hypothetical protein VNM45_21090 [Bacillus sp. (in: firmicutes)]|nr:hypothetical protein [Bacillus sp. (in: firmicutes)]
MLPSNFGEITIDYFISRILIDLEEFIFNDGQTSIDKETQKLISDWLEELEERNDLISEQEMTFIRNTLEESVGAMPIWVSDKNVQNRVLTALESYFKEKVFFYETIKDIYTKGLKEEGL